MRKPPARTGRSGLPLRPVRRPLSVRLRNVGPGIISSRGPNPVCLSYHWRNRWGKTVVLDGARSYLPIDLAPGRALTLPTLIVTPDRPGAYKLQLSLVHEGVGWLHRD